MWKESRVTEGDPEEITTVVVYFFDARRRHGGRLFFASGFVSFAQMLLVVSHMVLGQRTPNLGHR